MLAAVACSLGLVVVRETIKEKLIKLSKILKGSVFFVCQLPVASVKIIGMHVYLRTHYVYFDSLAVVAATKVSTNDLN